MAGIGEILLGPEGKRYNWGCGMIAILAISGCYLLSTTGFEAGRKQLIKFGLIEPDAPIICVAPEGWDQVPANGDVVSVGPLQFSINSGFLNVEGEYPDTHSRRIGSFGLDIDNPVDSYIQGYIENDDGTRTPVNVTYVARGHGDCDRELFIIRQEDLLRLQNE